MLKYTWMSNYLPNQILCGLFKAFLYKLVNMLVAIEDWTVRGLNPCGGEIFRTCPDRSWGPPSLLYNGYRVFPGGRFRPGRDADPSPPSSAVVMKG